MRHNNKNNKRNSASTCKRSEERKLQIEMGKKAERVKKCKKQKSGRGGVTERPPTHADDDFKMGKTAWQ